MTTRPMASLTGSDPTRRCCGVPCSGGVAGGVGAAADTVRRCDLAPGDLRGGVCASPIGCSERCVSAVGGAPRTAVACGIIFRTSRAARFESEKPKSFRLFGLEGAWPGATEALRHARARPRRRRPPLYQFPARAHMLGPRHIPIARALFTTASVAVVHNCAGQKVHLHFWMA